MASGNGARQGDPGADGNEEGVANGACIWIRQHTSDRCRQIERCLHNIVRDVWGWMASGRADRLLEWSLIDALKCL